MPSGGQRLTAAPEQFARQSGRAQPFEVVLVSGLYVPPGLCSGTGTLGTWIVPPGVGTSDPGVVAACGVPAAGAPGAVGELGAFGMSPPPSNAPGSTSSDIASRCGRSVASSSSSCWSAFRV